MAEKKTETGRSHEATWGANEVVKAAWEDKHAEAARKAIEKENERREADNG